MAKAKGTLIVVEAGDGSGKATQTRLLLERLTAAGFAAKSVTFPDYASESSALIKMYLAGKFGDKATDVDAYAAASFYAVDRYASYRMNWREDHRAGTIIVADRYTTSNMIHQAVKLENAAERDRFLTWLDDFEYDKLGLPRSDKVIFLDMPPEISLKLIASREAEGRPKDIHEKDRAYLQKCYEMYRCLAERCGWQRIVCGANGEPFLPQDISDKLYDAVKPLLRS